MPPLRSLNSGQMEPLELLDILDLRYYLVYSKLNDSDSLDYIKNYRKLEDFELFDRLWEYIVNEYYPNIQNNLTIIDSWIDNSLELLYKLDNEELKELFPN